MIIDCGSCAVAGLACDDCLVSVLLGPADGGRQPGDPMALTPAWDSSAMTDMSDTGGVVTDVDDEHAAAIEVLARSGLVPPLRLVRRSQAS